MKNKLNYTLLLGVFLLFVGCESNPNEPEPSPNEPSPNEPSPNESKSISKMNIGDATTLFIASSANGMAEISPKGNNDVATATKRLFKITEDGVVEDVVYTDEDGNEITESYIPENMYFIENSPYFFADFGDEGMFLVNKETGDVYKTSMDNQGGYLIDNMQLEKFGFFENSPFATTDDKGNIYYRWYEGTSVRVHKIDISNINLFTDKALTPLNEDVCKFVVSAEGDMAYSFINWTLPDYPSGRRYRSEKGKLSIAYEEDVSNSCGFPYRGLDGEIYTCDYPYRELWEEDYFYYGYFVIIQKVFFSENGTHSFDTVCEKKLVESMTESQNELIYGSKYLLTFSDKLFVMHSSSTCVVIDSKNKNEIGESFLVEENMKITDAKCSNSYIYCSGHISGNFSLLRIDPYTYSREVVMQDNDFEIYSFTVLDDETVMFNGMRLSDGKSVVASIDKDGKVKILDETLNSQESVLERIQ